LSPSSGLAAALLVLFVPAVAVADDVAPSPAASAAVVDGNVTEGAKAEAGEKPAEPEPLEVQVVGDRANQMQRVPGSVTVIGIQEVQRAEARDVAELLGRVPGVWVRQSTDGGGRLDIGIRGLDPGRSRRVLVLEDGVPASNNPYSEPDLYYATPVERVRSIEVLKGSGSLLYGPQTIGGVVNFLTFAPPERRIATVSTTSGEDGFVRWLARTGDRRGPLAWVGQAVFRRDEGFRDQASRMVDAMFRARLELGEGHEVAFKVAIHDLAAESSDVGLTSAMYDADPRRSSLAPDSRMELQRRDAHILHRLELTPGVALQTLGYVASTARVWRRQRYDRTPAADVGYERIVGDVSEPLGAIYFRDEARFLDREYGFAGVEPRLELEGPTGPISHAASVGLRVLGERAQLDEEDAPSAQAKGGTPASAESHRSIAFSGYVLDRLGFADDHVLVTPGVRIEHVRSERAVERVRTAGGSVAVAERTTSDDTAFIPGVGLTAGTPRAHAFGGVHVGYAPPRLAAGAGPGGEAGELPAERSLSWELGARARPADWQRIEATGFVTAFSNQTVASATGTEETELTAGGRTRHLGLELATQSKIGQAAGAGFDLDLTVRYGFADARFVGGAADGRQLPYAPSHTGSAALDAIVDRFGAQLALRMLGPAFADDVATENEDVTGRTGQIPAHAALDANARYDVPATGLRLSIQAKNILDEAFVQARRPEGISVGGVRQVLFTAAWDLERLDRDRESESPSDP